MNMKVPIALISLLISAQLFAQNIVSVPFGNGFVGDVAGNNSSTNSYYLSGGSGLGWSNVQFAQSSSSNIFVAQGNDIIGMVKITDYNGNEFSIDGYIKWRTPSGGSPSTMVFQPSPGSYVLATNGFNGSSQYTINENKYIGLTKLGQTLSISPVPGTVSGNAATSGLLDALNNVLAALPQLSVSGSTVQESDGVADVVVTLSASSTETVTVDLKTIDSTALSTSDYSAYNATLTFLPGETSKTIQIAITVDSISETSEFFMANITNPTYAAISKSSDSVVVLDGTLPVEFIGMNAICADRGAYIEWSTASENQSDYFLIQRRTTSTNWETIGTEKAKGMTNQLSEYRFYYAGSEDEIVYYRLKQFDQNGKFVTLPPVSLSCEGDNDAVIFPNPSKGETHLQFTVEKNSAIEVEILDLGGNLLKKEVFKVDMGSHIVSFDTNDLDPGVYVVLLQTEMKQQQLRLIVN